MNKFTVRIHNIKWMDKDPESVGSHPHEINIVSGFFHDNELLDKVKAFIDDINKYLGNTYWEDPMQFTVTIENDKIEEAEN